MPLIKGVSKKTVQKNTSELIHAGKSPKQAYAIAKSVQREALAKKRKKK